jgi:DNA-binding NtrC family response regulator
VKILLLDPDVSLTYLINSNYPQFEVVIADSSDDGIYKLNTGNFDLLITEHKLWGTENIFHILEDVVVKDFDWIVLSNEKDVKVAVDAVKAGAFDYFIKPYDPQELDRAITRVKEQRFK